MSFVLNSPSLPNTALKGLCLCLILASPLTVSADSDTHTDNTTLIHNPGITLSINLQTQAGIATSPPEITQYQAEFQASASVLDLQPLLNLREQYLTALAEHQAATAALNFTRQALSRTETLYRNGVNSQRQLQNVQLQQNTDQARLHSSQYRLQSLSDNLLSNWGSSLSAWAKTTNSPNIQAFINAQQALLLLTLPANQALPQQITEIAVESNGDRQKAQVAHLISKAPKGSEISQGETYFLQTPKAHLRTGMHLSAWITEPGTTHNGFTVPSSAIIWHIGQPGIFLKTAPEQFSRHIIQQYHPVTRGYFIADSIPAQAEIVTTGAQLLLSQELRTIIPTEDDGD